MKLSDVIPPNGLQGYDYENIPLNDFPTLTARHVRRESPIQVAQLYGLEPSRLGFVGVQHEIFDFSQHEYAALALGGIRGAASKSGCHSLSDATAHFIQYTMQTPNNEDARFASATKFIYQYMNLGFALGTGLIVTDEEKIRGLNHNAPPSENFSNGVFTSSPKDILQIIGLDDNAVNIVPITADYTREIKNMNDRYHGGYPKYTIDRLIESAREQFISTALHHNAWFIGGTRLEITDRRQIEYHTWLPNKIVGSDATARYSGLAVVLK
ncbi:MAG: hypothetical protein NDI94_01210 [Candidatus Woesearchaeota archaeon]|nr:hypothetical protein [Candidatus Woesearchaeota archaeon]